jgi:hypothetical protein
VRGFAASLQAAALTYHLTDPDRVVFCFPAAEAAQASAEPFTHSRRRTTRWLPRAAKAHLPRRLACHSIWSAMKVEMK